MTALPARPKAQHEVVREFLLEAGLCSDDAQILTRMWRANGARQSSAQLAAGIAGGGAAIDACKEARNSGRRRLSLQFAVSGFALAPEGVEKLSQLAGLKAGPAAGARRQGETGSPPPPGWDEVISGLRAVGVGRAESVVIARLWRAAPDFVALDALCGDVGPHDRVSLLGRALTQVMSQGVKAVGGRATGWRLTKLNAERVGSLAAREPASE